MAGWMSSSGEKGTVRVQAVAFSGCSGWLHQPQGVSRLGRGIILCSPFGYEEICTRRSWRQLADLLAAAGMPTLRFDYPGTGDSAGDDEQSRLSDWLEGIGLAASWLKQQPGIIDLALCGLRLGGLLAAGAARGLPDISALAMLAPPASGAAYGRELAMLAQSGAASTAEWLEVAGFRLHHDDLERMAGMTLADSLVASTVPRLMLLDMPGRSALDDSAVAQLGARLTRRPFAGCRELLRHAHLAETPMAAFAEVTHWLAANAPSITAQVAVKALPAAKIWTEGASVESAVSFGPECSLHGVLCQPAQRKLTAGAPPAVLLLNTGANRRIGNGRMVVRLARRLATRGITSLRIDASGIGDSPCSAGTGDGAVPSAVYRDELCADACAALDLLQELGYEHAVAIGLCAGAHVALQSALRDDRLVGLVLGNLPAFDRAAGGAAALDGGPPPGEHPWLRRPRMLWRRLVAELDRGLAGLGLESGLDRPNRWMRQLLRRGVSVALVYSNRDRGLRELRAHFGRRGRRLMSLPMVSVTVLDGTDHSMQPRKMQNQFMQLVEEQMRLHYPNARAARPSQAVPEKASARWPSTGRAAQLANGESL
jgi:pimeloyl-ACP methyl ester carboxylesterase